MLFNSYVFLIFFVLVQLAYWCLPAWRSRKAMLLIASYVFYGAWNPPYLVLLLAATCIDWWLARRIAASTDGRTRRSLLILSLVTNLGMLAYFKYAKFLLLNVCQLLGLHAYDAQLAALDIVLPIGISFYTFASLSYTVDVYRGELRADWRWADYALFVSFFPHLVAGPIVRASTLLPQIEHPRRPSLDEMGRGLSMVILGLAGKVILADSLFAPVADAVFGASDNVGLWRALTGVFSFAGQIYFDFAGYSLCALGLALSLGFEFPANFRLPYAASGFSDFWRRWHISLSSWLRDYLYISLGGNRHGALRTYAALVLTMLLGGLWHGATWMFVLWGALHGTWLVLERLWRSSRWASAPDWVARSVTLFAVCLTWIPFRARSGHQAWQLLDSLATVSDAALPTPLETMALAGFVLVVAAQWRFRDAELSSVLSALSVARMTALLTGCLLLMFMLSGTQSAAFIYFQF